MPIAAPLLSWFAACRRPLPWRREYAPYHVWLSEVMLQQTQMERAVGYFLRFVDRYPDLPSLAAAREDDLFKLWEGLGYYSRARNLLAAARIMMERHGGEVPDNRDALLALPGVGPYTAAAVLSIAYNRPEAVVDANVERVLARLFDIDAPVREAASRARIAALAQEHMPPGQARDYNQALMELGALVCLPRKPRCSACPLADRCEALRLDIVLERPVKSRPAEVIPLEVASGVLVHGGRVFIQKRPATGVWAGLWEFPGGCVEAGETPAQAVAREFLEETDFRVGHLEKLAVINHGYTKYRVALHCYLCSLDGGGHAQEPRPVLRAAQEYRWVEPQELAAYAFPAGHRKLLDRLPADLRFQARLAGARPAGA